jgi:hypothetical protein
MLADLKRDTPSILWKYGHDPRATFQPHLDLDGEVLESYEDPEAAASGFPGVPYYYPGELVRDPRMPTNRAWTARYSSSPNGVRCRIENRRYDPAKMVRPLPRTGVARSGRPIAVRARAPHPPAAINFHQAILSLRRWDAEVTVALALAR